MKWIESLKNVIDRSEISYSQSVLRKIIDDVEYNFFFLTNIDLNKSNGKIYFGSNPTVPKSNVENGIVRIWTSITILLSSYPICINIQRKDGKFISNENALLEPANIFTYLDEADPQSIYSKFVDKTYIPMIKISSNYNVILDSLFYESVYFEFELNIDLKELDLLLKLIEVVNNYNGNGNIHNHIVKIVKNRFVCYYIDFGSSSKEGLQYFIDNTNQLNYVKNLKISSYPKEITPANTM